MLEKLRDTGDKEYIYWPNRKEVINKQIEKILKLTRG
jgi:predicted lipoprotein